MHWCTANLYEFIISITITVAGGSLRLNTAAAAIWLGPGGCFAARPLSLTTAAAIWGAFIHLNLMRRPLTHPLIFDDFASWMKGVEPLKRIAPILKNIRNFYLCSNFDPVSHSTWITWRSRPTDTTAVLWPNWILYAWEQASNRWRWDWSPPWNWSRCWCYFLLTGCHF